MPYRTLLLTLLLAVLFLNSNDAQEVDVWIGSAGPAGIYSVRLDKARGKLSQPKLAAEIEQSGFIEMHPNGKYLFSTGRDGKNDVVAAFRINRDAATPTLEPINSQAIGDGGAACIAVDRTGRVLFSAQYGGGSVATFPINDDGSLGPRASLVNQGKGSGVDPERQATAHPHWVGTSPDNQFLMVPDLGKDCVVVYRFDADNASLTPHHEVPLPPGSGPRHMKFHRNGKWAYVLTELDLTIVCFEYDSQQAEFTQMQVVESLPADKKGDRPNSAAEIRMHPNGKFLYASNRGHDSIAVFAIDQKTGKLTPVQLEAVRGSWPRSFCLDPTGKWLIAAGQISNTLSLFEVDEQTGKLEFTRSIVNSPAPICVLFDLGAFDK